MATSKKRPAARGGAKKASAKAAKTSAKKSAKKAAPSRAAKAPPRPAAKTARKPALPKKRLGSREPPVPENWLTGTLTVQQGVLGVTTSSGFVSLETLADAGEKVEVVLQLGPQRTESLRQDAKSLLEFVEARADDSMIIIVRCCVA